MDRNRDFSEYINAYEKRLIHVEPGPAVMYIESVKGCPFSCAMCHYTGTKPRRIPRELLDKLRPSLKNLEVMAIHGQGEPLLGDLDFFVEQAIGNGCVLHMNTTGFLLTSRVAELLARTRLSVRFSIHAGRKETYRKIMGHDLGKTKRNITYLMELLEKSGGDHDIWFSFIVMRENVDEIGDFLHFAHDCGVHSVRFMRLISSWHTIRGARLEERDFTFRYFEQYNREVENRFLSRMADHEALARQLGIRIEWGSMGAASSRLSALRESVHNLSTMVFGKGLLPLTPIPGSCLAPWVGQPVIGQDGTVRLCCQTTYVIGNINESSMEEIWNSERMKDVRRAFARGHNPRACGYCGGFHFANYPNNAFKGVSR